MALGNEGMEEGGQDPRREGMQRIPLNFVRQGERLWWDKADDVLADEGNLMLSAAWDIRCLDKLARYGA